MNGRLPLWSCAGVADSGCSELDYSEGRPKSWAWGPGGLLCPGCRLRAVAAAKRGRQRPNRDRHGFEPGVRACAAPDCEETFEVSPTARRRRYCSVECRTRTNNAKAPAKAGAG